jgi:YggT family protein
MDIVCFLLTIMFYAVILWVILSWVVSFGRLSWGHPVRKLYDILAKAIDPILRPIRSVLPPVRIGGGGLDLSPLVLMFGLIILRGLVC